MAKSNEPFWWGLFSAGGVVAALLMPITIFITSLGVALGWFSADHLRSLMVHPLGKLYLLLVISLPLFHFAHRFRFTLVDLGLKAASGLISVLCYGSAIVGTLAAVVLIVRL
jgi:fumarate reductase subunit D